MGLAAHAEEIFATHLKRIAQHRRVAECGAMALHRLLGDLVEADAFDGGGGAEEVLLDEVLA
jgi:hypothetical protein